MLQANELILNEIISEVQSVAVDCKWFLPADRLITILNIKKEDYYRKIYAFKDIRYSTSTIKGFQEKDGEVLCLILQRLLHIPNVDDKFFFAGIYFHEKHFKMLKEMFIELIDSSLKKHKFDRDLMMLLDSATINFDDAFDSYFLEKFDIEVLIERCINIFTNLKSIDVLSGAELYLKQYLQSQLNYNRISFREITLEYRRRFYFELYGTYRYDEEYKDTTPIDRDTHTLLQFFNLDKNATKKDLKKKYKELIKLYHPDINKEGLEETKKIIENYNKLVILLN